MGLSGALELPMQRGAFCISIDVEMGWGVWDRPTADYMERCLRLEIPIVERLLELFGRYDVVATWAVVGRLMERAGATPAGFGDGVWYDPGLVERIRAASPVQEIGSHSYEHIYFNTVGAEQAEADLAAAQRVHEAFGLPFTSFVYPRNGVAHTAALSRHGIKVYRSVDQGFHRTVARRLGSTGARAAHLLDKFSPTTPALVRPIRHPDGIVELPSSLLFMSRNGVRRLVHPSLLRQKAIRGLRAAAKHGGMFHLWFHPSNFYYDLETQFRTFESILSTAAALRDGGDLDIVPMGHFAEAAGAPGR